MYVDTGYLVFQRGHNLMLQRFDPATFKLSGSEIPVALSSPVILQFSSRLMGTLNVALSWDHYVAKICRPTAIWQ